MVYATLTDLEITWRPLSSPTDQAKAQRLLDSAIALLDARLPALAANVTAGTVSAVLARMVVVDAVVRVLTNPTGLVSQTLGPEAVQYAGVRTLGTLAFTDAELALLTPAGDATVAGDVIGTARLGIPWGLQRELRGGYRGYGRRDRSY